MKLDRNIYMCPPDYLEKTYSINPWMQSSGSFTLSKAKAQWNSLHHLYLDLVPEYTKRIKPAEGLSELCFFGDSVFAVGDRAVFSRFATPERFPETVYAMEALEEMGIIGDRVPDNVLFEGSGETMLWTDKILTGFGQRSTAGAATYLQSVFEQEVIALELIDEKFYHLDTALLPVNDELIAYFPGAFTPESRKKIQTLDVELIELEEFHALSFALNSIVIGDHVIMHKDAIYLGDILGERGYAVYYMDISEFIKFGGGIKCLTFQHYLPV